MSERLQYLFELYINKTSTHSEETELMGLALEEGVQDQLKKLIGDVWLNTENENNISEEKAEKFLESIFPKAKVHRMNWKRIAIAASIVLGAGFGSYLLFFNKTREHSISKIETQGNRYKNDVEPGQYKAKLTLADGRTILLDSAAPGELAKQGSTLVLNKDGKLVYQGASATPRKDELVYNTLTTAKGETYATVLADGSKVWLNSGSSIKFPVAFVGRERKVEITGEAYFEVAKNVSKPFSVSVNGMRVEVLGTHFNVNGYNDEGTIKTTLLEGSVKVSTVNSQQSTIIKPGQQAQASAGGKITVVNNADLEQVLAWKNGEFYFDGNDIKAVMRQIERWYDVEVNYQAAITEKFGGSIPRDVTVAKLLNMLELTEHVHFKVEGKKITVMK